MESAYVIHRNGLVLGSPFQAQPEAEAVCAIDLWGSRTDAATCKEIIPYPGSGLRCQRGNTILVIASEHNGTNLCEGHLGPSVG